MALKDIGPFQTAAGRVKNRIGLVAFAKWLSRSHGWVGILCLAMVLIGRLFWDWRSHELWVVGAILGVWVVIGLFLSFGSRPRSLSALSVFDRAGNWKDQFSSAYHFIRERNQKKKR